MGLFLNIFQKSPGVLKRGVYNRLVGCGGVAEGGGCLRKLASAWPTAEELINSLKLMSCE